MPNLYRCETNKLPKKKNEKKLTAPKNKKLNFRTCQKNTLDSLNEVEHFLRNFKHFSKYIKLYKILK